MIEGAAVHQPPPQGDGRIVLNYVLDYLRECKANSVLVDVSVRPEVFLRPNYDDLANDLLARAEMGLQKYGTYLRERNGRDAAVDLFQELCDASMYSAQCKMEGKPEGAYFEAIVNLTAQVAASIERG